MVVNPRYGSLDIEESVLAPMNVLASEARTSEDLVARILEVQPDAIIIGTRPRLSADVIAVLEHCKVIVRGGVGVDNVDVTAAHGRNIVVCNVRNFCTDEVATHSLLLILTLLRRLPTAFSVARSGQWRVDSLGSVPSLSDVSVGVIGFGAIGRCLSAKLMALGLSVHACDPYVPAADMKMEGVLPQNLETLLAVCDVISVNAPLVESTRGLLDKRAWSIVKPGAYLVNTARANIVNRLDLLDALNDGRIAGAALDVLDTEPPHNSDPLLNHPNVIVTPHMAWYSSRSAKLLRQIASEQARDVLQGRRPAYEVNA
jgi:D-3-phosphoglycerate dehydrogenase